MDANKVDEEKKLANNKFKGKILILLFIAVLLFTLAIEMAGSAWKV